MDKTKFKTMLKARPKKPIVKLLRLSIIDGVTSWRPAHRFEFYKYKDTPYTGAKRGPKPGQPHANKGKKRDPAVVAKIKATNAARRATIKP